MNPLHRDAGGKEISREEMRRVAEEVAASFPLHYEGPELVLLPVDPHRVHAYWILDEAKVHRAQAEAGSPYAPLVLRVHETGAEPHWRDARVPPFRSSCYVDSLTAAQTYYAELGVSTPDGRLIPLLRSRSTTLPPNGISTETYAEVVDLRPEPLPFPLPPVRPSRSFRASGVPLDLDHRPPGDEVPPGPPEEIGSAGRRTSPAVRARFGPGELGRRVVEPDWEPTTSDHGASPSSPSSASDPR